MLQEFCDNPNIHQDGKHKGLTAALPAASALRPPAAAAAIFI